MPLIAQMNPDASTLAAGGPVDLDVSKIAEGAQVVMRWRQRPIFVFHRSQPTLDRDAEQPDDRAVWPIRIPNRCSSRLTPTNWHRSIKPEFGVLVGICTHLGCIPLFYPDAKRDHAGVELAGRLFLSLPRLQIRSGRPCIFGVPAPYNLPVPPHNFVNDTTLRVGERKFKRGRLGFRFDPAALIRLRSAILIQPRWTIGAACFRVAHRS